MDGTSEEDVLFLVTIEEFVVSDMVWDCKPIMFFAQVDSVYKLAMYDDDSTYAD